MTLATHYHVTATWTDGDDLLSIDEQINRGLVSEDDAAQAWKWDHSFDTAEDRQYVSLWATLAEAEAWRAEVGGIILAVECDTTSARYIDRVGEGHPAVMLWVDGENVSIVG